MKRCESGADCQEFASLDGTPLKPETVTLLGRACQHDGAACFALGRELGRTGHFKESLDRARQACKWADPNGCADLALLHADARAGAKDLEKAKTISRDACWEGAVLACYVYGGLRKREPGGAAEAAKLFAFACDQGMSEGCANGAASTRKVKHVEVQRLRRVQAEDVKSESTTGDPTVLEDWQKAK